MTSTAGAAAAVPGNNWSRGTVAEKLRFNFTIFKLGISNALGTESKRARSVWKNYALQNPTVTQR
jgi:hypothetical protein